MLGKAASTYTNSHCNSRDNDDISRGFGSVQGGVADADDMVWITRRLFWLLQQPHLLHGLLLQV